MRPRIAIGLGVTAGAAAAAAAWFYADGLTHPAAANRGFRMLGAAFWGGWFVLAGAAAGAASAYFTAPRDPGT